MSVPRDAETFGRLLRRFRRAAGLTQEMLAERSGVSTRTIQHLEASGVRPRRTTMLQLVEALALQGSDRQALEGRVAPSGEHAAPGAPRRRGSGLRHIDGHIPLSLPHTVEPDDAPPLVALPRPAPTNLPWRMGSLIGREGDVTALRDWIAHDRRRLITLTGVGGSGKTCLAVAIAAELLDVFVDGVWFVDLAPTASPALVPRIVAGALGVLEDGDAPILDTLLAFLRRRRLLLVLDNCEHVIDACAALVAHLLAACPDLHILATSRQPLQIDGERRWQVRPLAVPDPARPASYDDLAGTASVRLFVERAEAVDSTFSLTDANAASVGRICALLDGIPLAIELAASRISVLAVEQIFERLGDGSRVLANGRRTAPARQRTMEAALGWSYDLLAASEQALFRRLGTFAGGFDFEAAEAIAGVGSIGCADVPEPDTLDLLGRLVDTSLVVADRVASGRRYRLLEPVRQYAQHRLMAGGEEHGARARHAGYYAALAERAAPKLRDREQIAWLDRLETERNNLRAALSWITEQGEIEDGLRVMVALVPYWEVRGHFGEGRRWLEIVLEQDERLSPSGRRSARLAAGRLALWHGDLATAVAHFEALSQDAAAASRRDADVLTWLGAALGAQGAFAEAETTLQEAIALQEARDDAWGAAWAQFNLARAVGNRATGVTHAQSDMLHASHLLEESLRRFRALGDLRFIAVASMYQGIILVHAGERARPAQLLREGLAGLQAVGERGFLFPCVIALSLVAVVLGQPERAARLLGAAEALGQALGTALAPVNRRTHQNAVDRIRPLLTAEALAAARATGWIMTLADVLSEAHDLASDAAGPD